jgi:polygalacturonase
VGPLPEPGLCSPHRTAMLLAWTAAALILATSILPTAVGMSASRGNALVLTEAGAKCDGKSDDTVALQEGLNAGASDGRAVVVPVGATCLTQPLKLPSNLVLQLDGVLKAGAKWTNGKTMLYTAGV